MNLKQEHKIRHLSIEGFDGVGKTTLCKDLVNKLNLKFVTKPFHLLSDVNDELTNYNHIRDILNNDVKNRDLTSWFYCFSYAYAYTLKTNIITDRFYGSNYGWGGNESNYDIYKLCIEKFGKPDLTIILYAPKHILEQRMKSRDANDNNLDIVNYSERYYENMKYFLEKANFKYVLIDTSSKKPEEITEEVIQMWNKI